MVDIKYPTPPAPTYYTGDPSKWPNGVYVNATYDYGAVIPVLGGYALRWAKDANLPPDKVKAELQCNYIRLPAGTRTTFTFIVDN